MWLFGKKKKEEKTAKVEKTNAVKEENEVAEPVKKEVKKSTKKVEPKVKKEVENAEQEKPEKKEKKSIYRVIYNKEDRTWQIKKDGAKRVITSYSTKEEALTRVKELCASQNLKVIIHKKDGKFQKKK